MFIDLSSVFQSPITGIVGSAVIFIGGCLAILRELKSLKPAAAAAHLIELQAAKEAAEVYKSRSDAFKSEVERLTLSLDQCSKDHDQQHSDQAAALAECGRTVAGLRVELAAEKAKTDAKELALQELTRILRPKEGA